MNGFLPNDGPERVGLVTRRGVASSCQGRPAPLAAPPGRFAAYPQPVDVRARSSDEVRNGAADVGVREVALGEVPSVLRAVGEHRPLGRHRRAGEQAVHGRFVDERIVLGAHDEERRSDVPLERNGVERRDTAPDRAEIGLAGHADDPGDVEAVPPGCDEGRGSPERGTHRDDLTGAELPCLLHGGDDVEVEASAFQAVVEEEDAGARRRPMEVHRSSNERLSEQRALRGRVQSPGRRRGGVHGRSRGRLLVR